MSADWWASRLGGGRTATQPPPGPPAQAPQAYHPAVQSPYQAPAPSPAPQPHVSHVNSGGAMTEAQIMQLVREGKLDKMQVLELAGQRGGKGVRTETESCPNCGSGQYFQRKAQSKMGAAPAPYCHTCGYNGLFEQFGTGDGEA